MAYGNKFRTYRDPRSGEVGMFLASNGVKSKLIAGQHRINPAPCCGHDSKQNISFSISDTTGLWCCFHTACGKKGNWFTFTRLMGRPLSEADRYIGTIETINYTREWNRTFETQTRTPVTSNKYPALLGYCHERGISNETLDAWRVSSKGPQLVRFPIYGWDDSGWQIVNSRVIRCFGDGLRNWFDPSGGPTHLMLGNHLFDLKRPEKRIYIFEGQWDAMTAYELGFRNVFSLPNGAGISTNAQVYALLQYIPDDWEIYVCSDMDEAGHNCAERFFTAVGPDRFARLELPVKDLNDWWRAKPTLTMDEVLDTARGLVRSLDRTRANKIAKMDFMVDDDDSADVIVDTPYPFLTDYLQGGFYAGQTTSILAASGSGKTTIVNQIAMHVAASGVRCALVSLEDSPAGLRRKLKQLAMGIDNATTIGRENLTVTQLDGAETTHNRVIDACNEFINNGCKVIVIDNLDFISTGIGVDKVTTNKILVAMAIKYNVHMINVWQPNKIDPSKMVTSYNQKGLSDVLQDSSNYININRHPTISDVRIIEVEKCRVKDPGREAKEFLCYDHDHNLYEHIDAKETMASKGMALAIKVLRTDLTLHSRQN